MVLVSMDIKGLKEAQNKAEQVLKDLHGRPFLEAMRNATLMVQRDAKIGAPVDTGRLRASIVPEIRADPGGRVVGIVGSTVSYAGFVELGTKPHWVGVKNIGRWAKRHGLGERAVFVSGKAHKYLQNAYDKNKDRIIKMLDGAVKSIMET